MEGPISDDGLIAKSIGSFDAEEYERQRTKGVWERGDRRPRPAPSTCNG